LRETICSVEIRYVIFSFISIFSPRAGEVIQVKRSEWISRVFFSRFNKWPAQSVVERWNGLRFVTAGDTRYCLEQRFR